ncbi:hypothetical protein MASR2M15_28330 [Anaerolineales bacterium]
MADVEIVVPLLSLIEIRKNIRYQVKLDPQLSIGQISQHLQKIDITQGGQTLFVARPIDADESLSQLHLEAGDHVIMMPQRSPVRSFTLHEEGSYPGLIFESAQERKEIFNQDSLIVGRMSAQARPDLDLSHFLPARFQESISRQCLWLQYEDEDGWKIQKIGQTRVFMDDVELGDQALRLNPTQVLTFVKTSTQESMGSLHLQVVQASSSPQARSQLKIGTHFFQLDLGLERQHYKLRVSPHFSLANVVSRLWQYQKREFLYRPDFMAIRLVSPAEILQNFDFNQQENFYIHYQ